MSAENWGVSGSGMRGVVLGYAAGMRCVVSVYVSSSNDFLGGDGSAGKLVGDGGTSRGRRRRGSMSANGMSRSGLR